MSVDLFENGQRYGLYRHNQWRNALQPDHHDLWPEILKAYRRYRAVGTSRPFANVLTIGHADGLRSGVTITAIVERAKDAVTGDDGCCARHAGHDGACEWDCGDCGGTGRCSICDDECFCDDVIVCDWCDGTHACPSCDDGRVVDTW